MRDISIHRRAPWAVLALSAFLLSMGVCTSAAAQWVWKDKTGKVYSQVPPPPSVPEKDILQRPQGNTRRDAAPQFANLPASAASSAASGPGRTADPELEAKRKKAEQDEATKRRLEEDKLKAARAENCSRGKAHMRALEDGLRMARVNEKGEREVLDDKARAQEMQRAREVIASDCK